MNRIHKPSRFTYLLLVAYLLVSPGGFAQKKFEGVYQLDEAGRKTALVLWESNGQVVGSLYVAANQKSFVQANTNGDSFSGWLNGTTELTGLLEKQRLTLRLPGDPTPPNAGYVLQKVSKSTHFDPNAFFLKAASDNDPVLVGDWRLLRQTAANGAELGTQNARMRLDKTGDFHVFADNITPEMQAKVRMLWYTQDGDLYIKPERQFSFSIELKESYAVRGDTLTLVNNRGTTSVYVRK